MLDTNLHIRMWNRRWIAALRLCVPVLAVCFAIAETWALVGRPWGIAAIIGAADSALLGPGFYGKEVTENGMPYRWTGDKATIMLPWTRSAYLVTLRVDPGITTTQRLDLAERQHRLMGFDIQPGFRSYQVLWRPVSLLHAINGVGSLNLTLETPTRRISPDDARALGVVLSALRVREPARGFVSFMPLALVGLTTAMLALLLWPWNSSRRLALLAGSAGLIPLVYDLLIWHPPVGANYTWLPVLWLPWLVLLALTGLALLRMAARSTRGAALAIGAAALLCVGLLLWFRVWWYVDGPDYGWHLNHGGSWDRVFRAHEFYPFGFPLLLWLGQLWGGRDLLFGQTACLIATMTSFAATAALGWRLLGREQAFLAALLLLGSPIFIAYGVLASTDAMLAALTTLALLALCWAPRLRFAAVALAGFLLGMAYLFRYQALLLLGPTMIWLFNERIDDLPGRLRWLRRAGRFMPVVVLLLGFLIGSAPQWLLDIRDTGRPFFTRQYFNIWLFAYRRDDPIPAASPLAELWYILSFDPSALWRHWMGNLRDVAMRTIHELLIWPIGLLALVGMADVVLARHDRRKALLVLWIALYALVVTLTFNKARFFLPALPPLIVLATVVFSRLRDRLIMAGGHWPIVYDALQVGMLGLALTHLLDAERELALYGRFVFQ